MLKDYLEKVEEFCQDHYHTLLVGDLIVSSIVMIGIFKKAIK